MYAISRPALAGALPHAIRRRRPTLAHALPAKFLGVDDSRFNTYFMPHGERWAQKEAMQEKEELLPSAVSAYIKGPR